ncbi:MAG TPA: hypothetical protein VFT59_00165 [Candidatus Saccharimonadales bacterium]|nr:hypothetical protein [Candidatus Saccharimonadales bacterium]
MTQKFTQKYTVMQLLETVPVGTEFSWTEWPLHVTLADVFKIDWDAPTIHEKLTTISHRIAATAIADHDELFGPEKNVRVTILDMSAELLELHYELVSLLEKGNVVFNNPHYIKEGFRAHATVQSNNRLALGGVVTFNSFTLIDMFPNEDPYRRKVLGTIPFTPSHD